MGLAACRPLVLGSTHVDLDALYWGPQWSRREDFAEQVELAAAGARSVAEFVQLLVARAEPARSELQERVSALDR